MAVLQRRVLRLMINDRTRLSSCFGCCLSVCLLSLSLCVSRCHFSHAAILLCFPLATLIPSACGCERCVLTSAAAVFAAGDTFLAPRLTRPARAHVANRRSAPAAAVRLNTRDAEEPPVFESVKDLEGELIRCMLGLYNFFSPSRVSVCMYIRTSTLGT